MTRPCHYCGKACEAIGASPGGAVYFAFCGCGGAKVKKAEPRPEKRNWEYGKPCPYCGGTTSASSHHIACNSCGRGVGG